MTENKNKSRRQFLRDVSVAAGAGLVGSGMTATGRQVEAKPNAQHLDREKELMDEQVILSTYTQKLTDEQMRGLIERLGACRVRHRHLEFLRPCKLSPVNPGDGEVAMPFNEVVAHGVELVLPESSWNSKDEGGVLNFESLTGPADQICRMLSCFVRGLSSYSEQAVLRLDLPNRIHNRYYVQLEGVTLNRICNTTLKHDTYLGMGNIGEHDRTANFQDPAELVLRKGMDVSACSFGLQFNFNRLSEFETAAGQKGWESNPLLVNSWVD